VGTAIAMSWDQDLIFKMIKATSTVGKKNGQRCEYAKA
jgi:hypothetical protein